MTCRPSAAGKKVENPFLAPSGGWAEISCQLNVTGETGWVTTGVDMKNAHSRGGCAHLGKYTAIIVGRTNDNGGSTHKKARFF